MKEVFSKVRTEESIKKVMSSVLQHTIVEAATHLATARGEEHKTFNWKDKQLWCEHCKKAYHTKDVGWDLYGKPKDWKPRNQTRNNKNGYVVGASDS